MSKQEEFFLIVSEEAGPEEIKEKGSRFIGYVFPVKTAQEADQCIAQLRKQYKDATHVCSAFRLGNEVGEETYFRYSDDGEPGSTAGLPIFNELKSKGYLNLLTAVIRYFGGTKLGTGGLVRAYGAAARKVLDTVKPVTVYVKQEVAFEFPYSLTGEMMQVVNRYQLEILDRQYGSNGVTIKLAVPIAKVDAVSRAVIDGSSGSAKFI